MEIWKDVLNYEGIYQVSNYGNVRSKRRKGTKGDNEWYVLNPSNDKDGYKKVSLNINGNKKHCRIHVLVSQAFIEIPTLQINHKNGIRDDNRVENLEWVTSYENVRHAFKVLKRENHFKGKSHSEESRNKIRASRIGKSSNGSNHTFITINDVEYKGVRVACKELGINRSTLVSKIKNSITEFKSNGNHYTINSIKV